MTTCTICGYTTRERPPIARNGKLLCGNCECVLPDRRVCIPKPSPDHCRTMRDSGTRILEHLQAASVDIELTPALIEGYQWIQEQVEQYDEWSRV